MVRIHLEARQAFYLFNVLPGSLSHEEFPQDGLKSILNSYRLAFEEQIKGSHLNLRWYNIYEGMHCVCGGWGVCVCVSNFKKQGN